MTDLRVVGTSADHQQLLLSDKPRGTRGNFAVPIDKELLSVLQAAVYARRDQARDRRSPGPEVLESASPKAAPREIQRLLRTGLRVDEVAEILGCDEEMVDRFESPILYERAGVIEDAQRVRVEKARLGASGLALGDAVWTNLAQRRIRLTDDEFTDAWSATREEGQPWQLTFTFHFRGKQVARFSYDPRDRAIAAVNKIAADIGWVPDGTLRPNIPPPVPSRPKKTAKKKPVARKPVAKKKPVARKPVAKKKPAARRTTKRR